MFQDMFTLPGRWNRLNRLRFFGYGLMLGVVAMMAYIPVIMLAGGMEGVAMGGGGAAVGILSLVVLAGCVWVNICLTLKRLHDLDKSGWLFLLYFVPVVSFIFSLYLLFWPGTPGDNQYGPDPKAQ